MDLSVDRGDLDEAARRISAAAKDTATYGDVGDVSDAVVGSLTVFEPLRALGVEHAARAEAVGETLDDAGRMPGRAASRFHELDVRMTAE